MRRALILLALSLGQSTAPVPAGVRVGVFGLFHPAALIVSASGGVVSLQGDRDSCVLRDREEASLVLDGVGMRVACAGAVFRTGVLFATGPMGGAADLQVTVPDRITRRFHGRLDVTSTGAELVPVVSMDLETAVASVVAAEQIADRIGIINKGRLVLVQRKADLMLKLGKKQLILELQSELAVANLPVGHGGTFNQPNGGAAASVAVSWLDWQLRADPKSAKRFMGDDCGLCQDAPWSFQRKQFGVRGSR